MNIEERLALIDSCCGCGACENNCPVGALIVKPDHAGFLLPFIDVAKCVQCEKCIDTCAYKKQNKYVSKEETYAAISKNSDVKQSSSGGVFSSLAINVLNDGGTVYGCTMTHTDNGFDPHHIRINNLEELYLLQGSKYVQSEIGLTYREVKKDLANNTTVLFSGTPCQIDGLYGFLGKDYQNLFTIDTICHGVPNKDLFNRYIEYEENTKKAKIINYVFRDKKDGWKLYGRMDLQNDSGNRSVYFKPEESSYYQLFLDRYTYRENCYTCPFAFKNRPGDITIGDFWNIDLIYPELFAEKEPVINCENGVSVLVINSEKGLELMKRYGQDMELYPSEYNKVAEYNRQMLLPSEKPKDYEEFRKIMNNDYFEIEKWYQHKMMPIRLKRAIRRMVPSTIKKAIRKVWKR